MNPPTSSKTTGQDNFKGDETSRKVLDRLISVLDYERIEAIKQGSTLGRATHITEALRAVYESRVRLAFIRPATYYLRSSYPATSLQGGPEVTWRNELVRHVLRESPYLEECSRVLWTSRISVRKCFRKPTGYSGRTSTISVLAGVTAGQALVLTGAITQRDGANRLN